MEGNNGLAATVASGSPASGQYGTGSGNTTKHYYGGVMKKKKKAKDGKR